MQMSSRAGPRFIRWLVLAFALLAAALTPPMQAQSTTQTFTVAQGFDLPEPAVMDVGPLDVGFELVVQTSSGLLSANDATVLTPARDAVVPTIDDPSMRSTAVLDGRVSTSAREPRVRSTHQQHLRLRC